MKREGEAIGRQRHTGLEAAVTAAGLQTRGWCPLRPEEGLGTGMLMLIGNVGPTMWAGFRRWFEARGNPDPHPLDAWSRETIQDLADRFGARAVFPFDGPPWWPFQRWARRAEPLFPSPVGPLIHRQFGLWHAYRGALVFDEMPPAYETPSGSSPCQSCVGRPCLRSCPVDAIGADRYDVDRCRAYLRSNPGNACATHGCRARHACPVGRDYAYGPEQAAHHMSYFIEGS
jgi:hypothetical protein